MPSQRRKYINRLDAFQEETQPGRGPCFPRPETSFRKPLPPARNAAQLMGHADTTMIEKVYQHVFPSAMEMYAQKLRKENRNFFGKTHHTTQNATQKENNDEFKPNLAII